MAHVAYTPVVIVTSVNTRVKTLAAAKAAPDQITYGSPGNGTTIHLAGEIFNTAANIKLRPPAVTSARRSTSMPDVPSVAELGYTNFDVSTW